MSELPFDVPRGTLELLHRLADCILTESLRQNLVARSTISDFWQRHIVDSAQLVGLAPQEASSWVDVGSGAGLPGMVVAILTTVPVTLVEPRKKRATFLKETAAAFGLPHVTVIPTQARHVRCKADVISARAVARLDAIFEEAMHLSTSSTTWLLPKGRTWREEVASARETWQGEIEPISSITSGDAAVIVARKIKRRMAS